jgi:acyl-CoA thioester hydrolase
VPHVATVTVRFADLDPYDHVNHARYFSYFESARIELLEEAGFGMLAMKEQGYQIVLVDLTAQIHAPATLHDRLDITTSIGAIGRATTAWTQQARCDDRLIASLSVRAAFVGLDGRPRRVPDGFEKALSLLV